MPKSVNSSTAKRRVLLSGLTVLALVSACAPSQDTLRGEAIEGRVLEQSTNRPIADAIVVALWIGDLPVSIADSQTVCYHVLSTTSDTDGRYRFPAWEKKAIDWQRRVRPKHVRVTAYKRNYEFAETTADKGVYLRPFTEPRKERLGYLLHLSGLIGCYGAGNEKPLMSLYESLYDEARKIATSDEERDALQTIRRRALYAWSRPSRELTAGEIEQAIQNDPYLREQFQ